MAGRSAALEEPALPGGGPRGKGGQLGGRPARRGAQKWGTAAPREADTSSEVSSWRWGLTAYFYTEDSDTGVTGQRVSGRGRGPRTGVSREPHWAGASRGPAGPEAGLGQGVPGGHSIPWVQSGGLPGPQPHPVSKDRGRCWQPSGSATSPCRGDEVISVASMNYDPIVSKVAEVLASGRTIRKREVE